MKIKSLSHVGLTVADFASAVKWYHDQFGFLLVDDSVLSVEQVNNLKELYGMDNTEIRLGFLRAPGGGIIEIFEFEKKADAEKVKWNRPGPTHITLDVKNVEKWYDKLKAADIEFFSKPQTTKGADWVFLKDPDGNLIELIDMKMNNNIIKSFIGAMAALFFKKFKYSELYT